MAGDFKHITVNAAQDDEVILAGIGDAQGGSSAPAPAEEPAEKPASGPAPQPSPAPGKEPAPARAAREGAYRETTLDDLEGAKMPVAQRIVIVAAVVCIIGALVYYFVAMR